MALRLRVRGRNRARHRRIAAWLNVTIRCGMMDKGMWWVELYDPGGAPMMMTVEKKEESVWKLDGVGHKPGPG